MAFIAAIAERRLARRRMRWAGTAVLTFAAFAAALGAAAWVSNSGQTALASAALPPSGLDRTSFDARFSPPSISEAPVGDLGLRRGSSDETAVASKVRLAREILARRLVSQDWRIDFIKQAGLEQTGLEEGRVAESLPSVRTGVPLPRSRPALADLESRPGSALALADNAARPDGRTLLQKLSDLIPGRVTLASLGPDGGLFRERPDLAALGYDNQTAVYDISAHAVYLPNGASLEAHSGIGELRDDPEHVDVRNLGATPPAVYELKPRERLFHGVQALRMTPVEGSSTNGRSGLLTHSYMIGPNGDSNGCVSFKDYNRFLKAFNDGEVTRLVVVPSLSGATMAAQRPNTQS